MKKKKYVLGLSLACNPGWIRDASRATLLQEINFRKICFNQITFFPNLFLQITIISNEKKKICFRSLSRL